MAGGGAPAAAVRALLWLAAGLALAGTAVTQVAMAEDTSEHVQPTESECRPYIEKALKQLGTETPPGSLEETGSMEAEIIPSLEDNSQEVTHSIELEGEEGEETAAALGDEIISEAEEESTERGERSVEKEVTDEESTEGVQSIEEDGTSAGEETIDEGENEKSGEESEKSKEGEKSIEEMVVKNIQDEGELSIEDDGEKSIEEEGEKSIEEEGESKIEQEDEDGGEKSLDEEDEKSDEDDKEGLDVENEASAEEGDENSTEEGGKSVEEEGGKSLEEEEEKSIEGKDESVEEEGEQNVEEEGEKSAEEEGEKSAEEEGEKSAEEEGEKSAEEEGEKSAEEQGEKSVEEEGEKSVEEEGEKSAEEEEEKSAEEEEEKSAGEEGEKSVEEEGETNVEDEGEKSMEEGEKSMEEGEKSMEEGEKSMEEGEKSVEDEGEKSVEDEGEKSVEDEGEKTVEDEGEKSVEVGDKSVEEGEKSLEEGEKSVEESEKSVEEEYEKSVEEESEKSVEGAKSVEDGEKSEEEGEKSVEEGEKKDNGDGEQEGTDEVVGDSAEEQGEMAQKQSRERQGESDEQQEENAEEIGDGIEEQGDSVEKQKESAEGHEDEGAEKSTEQDKSIETGDESTKTDSSEVAQTDGESSEEAEGSTEEEKPEVTPEEELTQEIEIPENLRARDHIAQLLHLDDESAEKELLLEKTVESTLKELKRLYDVAIKPLETVYKYRDLSNRHFGDPEIFSKPLILFMGPWSGGKSSIINYLLDNEYTKTSLRTGAEPSPAYFNILMWGDREEILDGTQLAADWTFSGLQKFGQGLLDRLRGLRLPNKLLEKVNIVEIPGILEIRKQVERLFPFNDACQWFIDRADIIFLVYDPAKLDVGPETEAILDQLKGREYQTRIILNKADQVRPEELMRVQGTLVWNISPLMSSTEPPIMYSVSMWSLPYEQGAPLRLLQAQERAFLRDLRDAIVKRVENKIASARRFAVRVRNHAKMVDCYLTTYYNHKSFFGDRKKVSNDIIERPQNYHIYEGLSTLTNISRYDLPDPDVYRDFFRLNALYDFPLLASTCTYFRGCPINRLDVTIAYDLPELVGKYKKSVDEVLGKTKPKS